jgi:ABC-2 type transport system ATP-binding protein
MIGPMRRLVGPVIQLRKVERQFGPRRALADVDLAVGAGEIHGLLGPGGAGKTTLLRLLAGLLPATRGQALVCGHPSGDPRLRGRVGLVSVDEATAYHGISGLENLVFVGRLHGMAARTATERGRAVLHQVGLARAGDGPTRGWTPGMRLRLAFARALLTSPDVLLIDEPPEGVDAGTAAAVRALVSSHAQSGAAVICATRRLDELRELAGDVTLLAAGRVRYAGSVEALSLRAMAVSAEDVADRLRDAA